MGLKERRNELLAKAAKNGVRSVKQEIVEFAEDAATVHSSNKGLFERVKDILSWNRGNPDDFALITLLKDTGDVVEESEWKDSSERDWELL